MIRVAAMLLMAAVTTLPLRAETMIAFPTGPLPIAVEPARPLPFAPGDRLVV